MPMTLEQLRRLYILQKNHHENHFNTHSKKLFVEEHDKLLADVAVVKDDVMAPRLFKGQPNIPFALFRPTNIATPRTPRPLIIHTHGGPNVYMDKDNPHAEIAYFLSQGYVVACPNYRGSTGYPINGDDEAGWRDWKEKSNDKHHIYGPEDVYAVAKHMQTMPFVDPRTILLRGGSFGSFINAHLLAGVKAGKFESLFRGAHLSGGIKYPPTEAMPDNVALLITHSVKDDIAPFPDALFFMQKTLLRVLSHEIADTPANSVQVYVAQQGNHHLLDPKLELDDASSSSYQELVDYLQHTTAFIAALTHGRTYKTIDSYWQYRGIMTGIEDASDLSKEVLRQVYAYRYLHRDRNAPAPSVRPHSLTPTATTSSTTTLSSDKLPTPQPLPVAVASPDTRVPSAAISSSSPRPLAHYGPTLALLKLQLGERFSGDIGTDLRVYLEHHFNPINWSTRANLTTAGRMIWDDAAFVKQMMLAITHEEAFLKDHPDHMVMYHAAENNTLQLYSFINLWQMTLKGQETSSLRVIEEMRLFNFMRHSFDDVTSFLRRMRGRSTDEVFNNTPGFADRAIACNPSLISNAHSTASCSLWWYFNAKDCDRVPIGSVVSETLKVLGIYSPERMNRYIQLFERAKHNLQGSPQALLQQIFIPYSLAKDRMYLCQIWGREFGSSEMRLESPDVIRSLIREPELFEDQLRLHKSAFTNFGDCEGFGDISRGFKYSNTLQMRYLPGRDLTVVNQSYLRSADAQHSFVTELMQLINEDYADHLVFGTPVPDFIIPGTAPAKKSALDQSKISFFPASPKVNHHAFYLEQRELYEGLFHNPRKEIYGGILALDATTKIKIQEQLRKDKGESSHPIYLYSLCNYLKGYTYYDLLKEAATFLWLEKPKHPRMVAAYQEDFNFVMSLVDSFSIPASISTEELSSATYHRLYDLMQNHLKKYEFNAEKHQFFPSVKGALLDNYAWSLELSNAVQCILRHARLAKERGNGHDVSSALWI